MINEATITHYREFFSKAEQLVAREEQPIFDLLQASLIQLLEEEHGNTIKPSERVKLCQILVSHIPKSIKEAFPIIAVEQDGFEQVSEENQLEIVTLFESLRNKRMLPALAKTQEDTLNKVFKRYEINSAIALMENLYELTQKNKRPSAHNSTMLLFFISTTFLLLSIGTGAGVTVSRCIANLSDGEEYSEFNCVLINVFCIGMFFIALAGDLYAGYLYCKPINRIETEIMNAFRKTMTQKRALTTVFIDSQPTQRNAEEEGGIELCEFKSDN